MAKSAERLRAYQLRRQGKSVKEIARIVGVSRGSVSAWVSSVSLTNEQKESIHDRMIAGGHRGRLKGAETNRKKKLLKITQAKDSAIEQVRTLSNAALFYTGLGLYWGEGVKATQSSTAIINSDVRVVLLMMRWFEECFGVNRESFNPRIFISDTHRDRAEVLISYWSKTLDIPRGHFANTVFLTKRKKVYENRERYYGVMALQIRKGTELKYRIIALIDRVAELAQKPV